MINFVKNGVVYELPAVNAKTAEAHLVYEKNGEVLYVPAISEQGSNVYGGIVSDNGYQWYFNNNSPTIAFRKNGKTYYCARYIVKTVRYSIPAGTYTISAFQTMIKSLYGISSWGTGSNRSYISKTWSNTNVKQDGKVPNVTTGSCEVRLYRYGNGTPYFSYDWLTGYNWNSNWNSVAYLYGTSLAGIAMYAGECAAVPMRNSTYAEYPVTVVDGIIVT